MAEAAEQLAARAMARAGRPARILPPAGDGRGSSELRGVLVERADDQDGMYVPVVSFSTHGGADLRVGDTLRIDNRELELVAQMETNALSQTWRCGRVAG